MKGILITGIDFRNGTRPGNIPYRSGALPGHVSWQDVNAGIEVRLIKSGNADPYRGIAGITVLENRDAVRAATLTINIVSQDSYRIVDLDLFSTSYANNQEAKTITNNISANEQRKLLYDLGVLGIERVTSGIDRATPEEVAEIFGVVDS